MKYKYNKGDYVLCLHTHRSQFTEGEIYRVRENDNETVLVEVDDLGSEHNGWHGDHFIVINFETITKLERAIYGI